MMRKNKNNYQSRAGSGATLSAQSRAGSGAVLRVTSVYTREKPASFGGVPPTLAALDSNTKRLMRKYRIIGITIALALLLLTAPLAFADGRGIPAFDDYVKVENDDQAIVGMGNTIKTIEHHARSSGYVVRGLIRYDVEGRGIALLQIRSTPLDNLSTRSMNDFVMTQKLLGTSQQNYGTDEFRQFYLYFHRGSGKPETVLTSISVWLHGKGTVELADLRVDDVAYATGEWWNSRESGLVGAWMGIGLGCFYVGLFCTLYLLLVPRGKGRQLLTGILLFMPIMGTAMLLFGISAWYLGQPWHVWYPFLSCGFICCILWIFPYRETMAKYNEFDQRRMQALDM